ncbi:hypothetical protein QFZ76_004549 [Streptomyces sp. V4I2]|nr:hypothetical protein [Streptomyces sp. V4I2]
MSRTLPSWSTARHRFSSHFPEVVAGVVHLPDATALDGVM